MTEEPLLIRSMTAGDVAAAVALEYGTPGAWSEEALATELQRPGGWQYIGLSRANPAPLGHADREAPPCELLPVCYACGHVVDQEAELYRIAVAANRRQQGIGTFFLRSLLHSLTNLGVTTCWLEVRASNTAAIRLYLKVGFTKKGERKKYYADPPEDAIIMQWISKTLCDATAHR